jgi:hypothetical protein
MNEVSEDGLENHRQPRERVPLFWHNDYAAIVVSASRIYACGPSLLCAKAFD